MYKIKVILNLAFLDISQPNDLSMGSTTVLDLPPESLLSNFVITQPLRRIYNIMTMIKVVNKIVKTIRLLESHPKDKKSTRAKCEYKTVL